MRRSWLALLLAGCLVAGFSAAQTPIAVAEAGFVEIGGIEQWLRIHGADTTNPLLFWLNGGPGGSTMEDAFAFGPWEKDFTLVMWDQRGEGKTFEKYGATLADTMTIERMRDDGIAVAEYLHKKFPGRKLILLGHSWGSILGIHMIRHRPDLFDAYVGTGQVTALPEQITAAYPLALARAKALDNADAIKELTAVGAPSMKNPAAYEVTNKWGSLLEPAMQPPVRPIKRPSAATVKPAYLDAGAAFSHQHLDPLFQAVDLPAQGSNFATPMFFIQGEQDIITTTAAVQRYHDQIKAPYKKFITLPQAGHFAIFRARDAFLDALLKDVRPVVTGR